MTIFSFVRFSSSSKSASQASPKSSPPSSTPSSPARAFRERDLYLSGTAGAYEADEPCSSSVVEQSHFRTAVKQRQERLELLRRQERSRARALRKWTNEDSKEIMHLLPQGVRRSTPLQESNANTELSLALELASASTSTRAARDAFITSLGEAMHPDTYSCSVCSEFAQRAQSSHALAEELHRYADALHDAVAQVGEVQTRLQLQSLSQSLLLMQYEAADDAQLSATATQRLRSAAQSLLSELQSELAYIEPAQFSLAYGSTLFSDDTSSIASQSSSRSTSSPFPSLRSPSLSPPTSSSPLSDTDDGDYLWDDDDESASCSDASLETLEDEYVLPETETKSGQMSWPSYDLGSPHHYPRIVSRSPSLAPIPEEVHVC